MIRIYSSHICQRSLNWEKEDELSIALASFNKAIDTIDHKKGRGFLAYAKHLIKNALIDYFRGQKPPTLSPPGTEFWRSYPHETRRRKHGRK